MEIPIENISKHNDILVDFLCEDCGDIIKMKYRAYCKNINKKHCKKCNNRNNMLEKYEIDKKDNIEIINKKRCRLCGEYKDYEQYHKFNRSKDGLRSYCKECRKIMTLEYRQRNSKILSQKQMLYDKNNKHARIWKDLLRNSLRRLGKIKMDHTITLLDYSVLELKNHLESLFTKDMNWENYGEWHIDHIRPLSSFDKETQPSIVNALSNLQPLWSTTREIDGIIYEGNLNKGKY